MSFWKDFRDRLGIIGEFLVFLKRRKRLWLAPLIVVLILLGLFIVFLEGSALAPFIYTLF
ncbi:MAG TPA: hypothetical protein ENJ23_03125 [Bacteroidetes bacterium]|nr:hypothetical protein [Bacteroidota bacterium]